MTLKAGEVEIRATPQVLRRTAAWLRRWAPRRYSGGLLGDEDTQAMKIARLLQRLSLDRRRRRMVLPKELATRLVSLARSTALVVPVIGKWGPTVPPDVQELIDQCASTLAGRRGRPRLTRRQVRFRLGPEVLNTADGGYDESARRKLQKRDERERLLDAYVADLLKSGKTLLTG